MNTSAVVNLPGDVPARHVAMPEHIRLAHTRLRAGTLRCSCHAAADTIGISHARRIFPLPTAHFVVPRALRACRNIAPNTASLFF